MDVIFSVEIFLKVNDAARYMEIRNVYIMHRNSIFYLHKTYTGETIVLVYISKTYFFSSNCAYNKS